jgi:hypothetical protein
VARTPSVSRTVIMGYGSSMRHPISGGFGQPQQQSTMTGGGLFGAAKPAQPLFGATATNPPTGGLFGGQTTTSGGLFAGMQKPAQPFFGSTQNSGTVIALPDKGNFPFQGDYSEPRRVSPRRRRPRWPDSTCPTARPPLPCNRAFSRRSWRPRPTATVRSCG